MATPVRVAVIGLGAWGTLAHLPALLDHPAAEVVAVVDPEPGRAAAVAAQLGITRGLTDAAELWAEPDRFDAVVVATPTDTHRDLVLPALALGRHVLCEKPLAWDLAAAREMTAAAAEADARARAEGRHGVVARLGFMFRGSPALRRMRELLAGGFAGEPVLFQSHTMNGQFADPAAPMHWKMRRSRANGGVHAEYGAHALDLCAWLVAPPTRIVAQARTITPRRPGAGDAGSVDVDVDDAAAWLAELEGGAQAAFQTSWATLPVGSGGVRVYGTRGSLAWQPDLSLRESEAVVGATLDRPAPETLFRFRARDRTGAAAAIGISADYNDHLIGTFLADIRDGGVTGPTFTDGLRAQAALAAVGASLASGGWAAVERSG